LIVRSLIVGQDTAVLPRRTGAQLKNVKTQLLKPKTANKVITQLRALPAFPCQWEQML
jgi:hypothetical protein